MAASRVGQAMLAVAIDAAIAGTLSSMVAQVITTGSLNIGAALKAGAVAAVTAGLTQGALAGLNVDKAGVSSFGDNIAKGNWSATSSNIGSYAEATVVRSAISAGVNTAVYGGSFGQAFAGGLVKDAAAVAANGIGGSEHTPEGSLSNVLSHALLGCAAQSLGGGDCAGGAIGGAASAIAAPLVRDGLYDGSQTVVDNGDGTGAIKYENTAYNAATVALATLIGGSAGQLLGANATAAALAAQNESLNNALSVKIVPRPVPTPFGVVMMPMPVVTDDPIGTPNNGPQKSDPLTNPLEDQNSKGNAIATPNNGPQGSTLTGTPATNPRGPTILANPGCRSAAGLPCAAVTVIASVKDGVDKLSNVLSGGTGPASASSDISGSAPMINGVTVTDRATGNVYQGTVDLQPTLDRIASGVKYPSRNDGATFNNNEGLLPQQPAGYYTEYVVPTPNVKGVGPQRIVTGKNGEVFYTPDHYKTFTPVKR